MRKSHHPMHAILTSSAEYINEAYIHGHLYQIADYPGVIPSQYAFDKVFGELYLLKNTAILNTLDHYEECSSSHPLPHEYSRQITTCFLTESSQILQAWCYFYRHPIKGKKRLANGQFCCSTQSNFLKKLKSN